MNIETVKMIEDFRKITSDYSYKNDVNHKETMKYLAGLAGLISKIAEVKIVSLLKKNLPYINYT